MGVGRGMGVWHPLVKVSARAKIVIFRARVRMFTRWALLDIGKNLLILLTFFARIRTFSKRSSESSIFHSLLGIFVAY
jgi:hypothetical protein